MKQPTRRKREPPAPPVLYTPKEAAAILSAEGLAVTVIWIRQKARGYRTRTTSAYGKAYLYAVPGILTEGEHFETVQPNNKLFLYQVGISLLAEERRRELSVIRQGKRSNRDATPLHL